MSHGDWSAAEKALHTNKNQAKELGYIDGVTKGTQTYERAYYNRVKNFANGEFPLMAALRLKAPESLVLALIGSSVKNAFVEKDTDNLLPFHLALINSNAYSIEVLCALYAPAKRLHPMHNTAMQLKVGDSILSQLFAEMNEILTVKDENGNLPVHCAIMSGRSITLVREMISGHPNALKIANSDGFTPFHAALYYSDSDDSSTVMYLLEEFPMAAGIVNMKRDLPLHTAIVKGMPSAVLTAIVEANPFACKWMSGYGDYPIHAAIENEVNASVLTLIAEKNPKALMEKGSKDLDPMALALKSQADSYVICTLLQSYVALNGAEESMVLAMKIGAQGNLPLHIALANKASSATLLDMIKAFPEAAKVKDTSVGDKLPIELAIEYEASAEVVVGLLIAYPEGLDSCKNLRSNKLDSMTRACLKKPVAFWKSKKEQVDNAFSNAISGSMLDLRHGSGCSSTRSYKEAESENDEPWSFIVDSVFPNDAGSVATALTDNDTTIEELGFLPIPDLFPM